MGLNCVSKQTLHQNASSFIMGFTRFWVNLDIFYDGEISQPFSEWGSVVMNNELIH